MPVGATPVVVAVKVTLAPAVDRIRRARKVGGRGGLVDHLRQRAAGRCGVGCVAAIRCDDAARADGKARGGTGWRCAIAAAGQGHGACSAAMDNPPSLKLTLPVGATPVVVAVNVTLAPAVDGLSELASTVVLGIRNCYVVANSLRVAASRASDGEADGE